MLETLGQYARERLDEHGEIDRWRRRHAEYFAAWAEEAGPGLLGPDEFAWRTRENAELDNLRAAVTWALDRDDPDDIGLALRIIGALADETTDQPGRGHRGVGRTGPAPRRDHDTAAALRRDRGRGVSPVQPRELRRRPGARAHERSAMAYPPGAPAPADAHCDARDQHVAARGARASAGDRARRGAAARPRLPRFPSRPARSCRGIRHGVVVG